MPPDSASSRRRPRGAGGPAQEDAGLLLIQGRDQLFLVPDTWSASNSTLVVPWGDGSVRVHFRFVDEPP